MTCCQRDDLTAPAVEERVGADLQRSGSQLRQCREGHIEVTLVTGAQNFNLQSEGPGCLFNGGLFLFSLA
jgi:hypothetical protein